MEPLSLTPSGKLVFAAILATFSAILQSAGGFLPGIGLLISPFSTLPIVFVSVYAGRYGILSYGLAMLLLLLIQPAELFIFPFSTGLLGLALGLGIRVFKYRITVALFAGGAMFAGICFPLYVLGFPILVNNI
jgi:hypothetical protein